MVGSWDGDHVRGVREEGGLGLRVVRSPKKEKQTMSTIICVMQLNAQCRSKVDQEMAKIFSQIYIPLCGVKVLSMNLPNNYL